MLMILHQFLSLLIAKKVESECEEDENNISSETRRKARKEEKFRYAVCRKGIGSIFILPHVGKC